MGRRVVEDGMNKFEGKLEPFWETGTEGVLWALEDNVNKGYDSLHILKNGDQLTVWDDDGFALWHGVIDLEYETRKRPFPMNPQYSQQEIFGHWIHGLQRDADPETWAKMFFDRRRATLTVKT